MRVFKTPTCIQIMVPGILPSGGLLGFDGNYGIEDG
jgi:hypothetical protein